MNQHIQQYAVSFSQLFLYNHVALSLNSVFNFLLYSSDGSLLLKYSAPPLVDVAMFAITASCDRLA